MELNIKDFLTKEHKKAIEDKITQAIDKLDVNEISEKIKKNIDWGQISEYVLEDVNYNVITEHFDKLIKEKIKNIKTL